MKKLEIVRILAAAILIGGVISIPLINNHTAYKVEKALCEIPLPEETELIESLSQAGKLTGNGNGMQYFGAILIRSELSLEELDAYYSDYRRNEWEYLVEIQKGQSIEVIDHGGLQFSFEIFRKVIYFVITDCIYMFRIWICFPLCLHFLKLILIIKMSCHHSYKIIKFHHILYLLVFA